MKITLDLSVLPGYAPEDTPSSEELADEILTGILWRSCQTSMGAGQRDQIIVLGRMVAAQMQAQGFFPHLSENAFDVMRRQYPNRKVSVKV